MAAVSMHKSGGSLTQSSLLLLNKSMNAEKVRQIINLTQTTSASYLLLSSLDISRRNLALRGEESFEKVAGMAQYAREEINEIGACRICVVEVVRAKTLVTACVYPVNEGMEIYTNSPRVMKARKMTLELMLSTHDKKCLSCVRSENCELQKLCRDYGVEDVDAFEGENPQSPLDETTLHMVRDNNKCILCRRCVAACEDQFVGVIGPNGRGFDTHIGCAFEKDLATWPAYPAASAS